MAKIRNQPSKGFNFELYLFIMNMKLNPILILGIVAVIVFGHDPLLAQDIKQLKKLIVVDRDINDQFGYTTAISGNLAIISAPFDDEDEEGSNFVDGAGAVYFFGRNQGGAENWGLIQKAVAPDRATGDNFGISVSINGTLAIVGAPQQQLDASGGNSISGAGAAYVFSYDESGEAWEFVKKIVPSGRSTDDEFGKTLSISGDYIVVGAPGRAGKGSAFVYGRNEGGENNWGLIKQLDAADGTADDAFAVSVGISSDNIAVGAPQEDEDRNGDNNLFNAGSVYIFNKNEGGENNWGQIAKIVPDDRGQNDGFGSAVSIFEDVVLTGATKEDEDETGMNTVLTAGSAYIFQEDAGGEKNWGQIRKLVAPDRAMSDEFGTNVTIFSNFAIVGVPMNDTNDQSVSDLPEAGSAYVYGRNAGGTNQWGFSKKITPLLRASGDQFGAVSVAGAFALVGAPFESENENEELTITGAGGAFIFGLGTDVLVSTEDADFQSGETFVFDDILEGRFAEQQFTIRNLGSEDLIIAAINVTGSAFQTVGTIPETIAAQEEDVFTIQFSPTSGGLKEALAEIVTNDANAGNFILSLEGNSVPITDLDDLTENAIKIYPNPTDGITRISSTQALINARVQIADLAGRLVLDEKFDLLKDFEFDSSQLAKGVYLIDVNSRLVSYSSKLIKQ